MLKIIFLSLNLFPLSIFSMEQQPAPSTCASRQPFVWADIDSYPVRTNLQKYAALPGALVSGIHFLMHADEIKAVRRSLKSGLITGSFLAAWVTFFSPEFKAIRAEKEYKKICDDVEAIPDLREVNPEKAEYLLRMHAENIHNLKEKLGRIKKQRYERNPFFNPRNEKFYARCEALKNELAAAQKSLERGILNIELKNI
jgi:hypothetical protein